MSARDINGLPVSVFTTFGTSNIDISLSKTRKVPLADVVFILLTSGIHTTHHSQQIGILLFEVSTKGILGSRPHNEGFKPVLLV